MKTWSLKYIFLHTLTLLGLLTTLLGCGAVGAPIAPEDVGIEAKVRKQQQENVQAEEALSEKGAISVEEEGVQLPAFYPIGTR